MNLHMNVFSVDLCYLLCCVTGIRLLFFFTFVRNVFTVEESSTSAWGVQRL